MSRRAITRLQVSGHRFLTRRIEYALVCRDVRMLDDPIRAQALSLSAGVAVTAIVVAVCAVLALLRPQGTLGDHPIVVARESGAVYVRVGDLLHPVPNLASARLIARTPAQPRLVSAAVVAGARHGPTMGIPGAPATIDTPVDPQAGSWTVCDGADHRTTLVVGAPEPVQAAPAILVTSRTTGRMFLLDAGHRAAVDVRDTAVVAALEMGTVIPVSQPLLDTLPERAAVRAGTSAPGPARGVDVGGVLCARWTWTGPGHTPHTVVFTAATVPGGQRAVHLAQADGPGPHIDAVALPAGRTVFARAAGVAGDGWDIGPWYLITATGVAFGIGDAPSAAALGLPEHPGSAPWPVLALLPRGPELSIDGATFVRDSLAAP